MNNMRGRIKKERRTDETRWQVTSRYHHNGIVECTEPEQLPSNNYQLGWISEIHDEYDEFRDFFAHESSAQAFIRDNKKEYGKDFRIFVAKSL